MSLSERLMEDMKAAMKEKEAGKDKLTVIRMARAAIKNVEIDKKQGLTDEEVLQVLAKEIKQRKDSIPEYEKADRADIVSKLQKEIEILQEYLPTQLTEAEIKSLILEAIAEVDAKGPADMGKVMNLIMPKVTGRADGRLISQMVKQLLA
ncbi:MAG: GatB/YqeY domain-containing protein [Bacillota bacterium]|nr:GatB/YqeY domain-containing protein [Bacillota bacterium]